MPTYVPCCKVSYVFFIYFWLKKCREAYVDAEFDRLVRESVGGIYRGKRGGGRRVEGGSGSRGSVRFKKGISRIENLLLKKQEVCVYYFLYVFFDLLVFVSNCVTVKHYS